MKRSKLVRNIAAGITLSLLLSACGGKKKGPDKTDLDELLSVYEIENKKLSDENRKLNDVINLKDLELSEAQQKTGVDQRTINDLLESIGVNNEAVGVNEQGEIILKSVTFNSGKHRLNSIGINAIKQLISKDVFKTGKVVVMGHTDSDPIRKSKNTSNWDLSAKRATAVVETLERMGVSKDRLELRAYADTISVPGGKSSQRRIAIKIVKSRK